jgi:hypothetical protein
MRFCLSFQIIVTFLGIASKSFCSFIYFDSFFAETNAQTMESVINYL